MNRERISDWLQLGASIGVILSLIFVGLEIQQSREIAIADIYQQRTALMLQQLSFVVPPEAIDESWRKERAGEELTQDDEFYLYMRTASRIAYWENNHFQYQQGLLSEEQWVASSKAILQRANDPQFRRIWDIEREIVRKSFADVVDEILDWPADEN
jgi:hypothetical protein